MNKSFFRIGLGLLVLTSLVWPADGAVTGPKTLSGHVPSVVSQLAPVSRLSAATNLYLSIGLPLRNQNALTNLLREISDPASPNYRHYLTPEEFTAQFGPTESEYQAVINFAASNGLAVAHTHPNRMLVDVVAKVPDVERAFHVNMMKFHHPKEPRDFYAPDAEPTVEAALPVLSVQGMNNYTLPRSMLQKRPASIPQPSIGTGPGGSYMGQDFRNAYLPGSTLNGAGQTVGLLQFDGYFTSDILTYESIAGLPNVPLQNVLLDGFNGSAGPNNAEVCLDIEMVIAMAPGLSKVVVFEAGPFGNPNDILNSMASSNQIKVLSSSWGYTTDPTTQQIYIQFALQGQTYFNCSGDGDAWINGTQINGFTLGSVENPFVTVVGGTTLTMNGPAVSYASERAWNWGFIGNYNWNPNGYFGTSGGISTDIGLPPYQQGINMTNNHGSTTFRNVPDIALTADNIFVVYDGGSFGIFGGTSAATPLWAGFMALINQQAVANGQATFGFIAPTLYALAKTTNYATCFHDVILGNNTWDLSTNNFFAVPGYDLCTGLGTPNGTNLINTLTASSGVPVVVSPVIPAPLQPWGSTLSVMNGANPNGLWMLFIQDDTAPTSGTNYNGWSVCLTTANPVGQPGDNQLYVNSTVNATPYGNATNVVAILGSIWHTTLAVTNYGPSLSSNVFIVDTLPPFPAVTLVSSNRTLGVVTNFGGALVWNVGNLAVNAGGTLTLNFQVNNTGVFTNSATVNALSLDPNPDDDTVNVIATVGVAAAPLLSPTLVSGGNHMFKLSVTNNAGATIVIQSSTNLLTWQSIYTNVAPFTFTNINTIGDPQRFYRAVGQ